MADLALLDAVIAADACATDFKGCIGAPADLRGLKVLAPRRWIDGPLAEGNAAALALAKASPNEYRTLPMVERS